MIQFNLLPDIKVEYIKTRRLKRIIMLASVVAIGFSVAVVLLTASYSALMKQHVSNQDADIAKLKTELEATPDLTKILSVQNQLNTLPSLYEGRPAVDRLPGYLDQTTPTSVSISRLNLDFSLTNMEISGTADTLETVYRYVDTLKFTTFQVKDSDIKEPAFTSVVLQTFGREDNQASFVVSFIFNPTIFDERSEVSLTVPSLQTTRVQVESATELFRGTQNAEAEGAE